MPVNPSFFSAQLTAGIHITSVVNNMHSGWILIFLCSGKFDHGLVFAACGFFYPQTANMTGSSDSTVALFSRPCVWSVPVYTCVAD